MRFRVVQHRCTRRGFTLVEVIVAVAITAMLMVAMATAFKMAVQTQQASQGQVLVASRAQATLTSILARARMTPDIKPRNADKLANWGDGKQDTRTDHGVTKDNGVADTTGFVLTIDSTPASDPAAAPVQVTYEYAYDSAKQQLTVAQNSATPAVLLSGVTAFEARLFPAKSAKAKQLGQAKCDTSSQLAITMTVESPALDASQPKPKVTVTGSALPRAAVWQGRRTSYPIDDLLNNPNDRKKPK